MKILTSILFLVAIAAAVMVLKNRPSIKDDPVEESLARWSEFLFSGDGDDARNRTESLLRRAVEGGDVGDFLESHPMPDKWVFRPSDVSEGDFRDLKSEFGSIKKFREFLASVDEGFRGIGEHIHSLPERPFLPKTLETVEDRIFPVGPVDVDTDQLYLPEDFTRFRNIARFAKAFREDATSIGWVDYNDHFKDSVKGSPTSVLLHIATMPDMHLSRFSRSDGERSVADLLSLIRKQFPVSE